MRIFIITNWRFHGNRFFGNFQDFTYLHFVHFQTFTEFFRCRFAAHFLQQLTRNTVNLVNGFNHVYRNTDGTCLIGNRTGDRLTNPPSRISRELVTTTVFKLVYRFHQTDVTFLNQIQELQAAVGVFLGNRDHQTQVGFDHFFLGATCFGFTHRHTFGNVFNVFNIQTQLFFDVGNFLLEGQYIRTYFFQVAFHLCRSFGNLFV